MSGNENFSKNATLCWKCKNAVPKKDYIGGYYITGCDWSLKRLPVDGWTATRSDINLAPSRNLVSYCVHICPLFEEG